MSSEIKGHRLISTDIGVWWKRGRFAENIWVSMHSFLYENMFIVEVTLTNKTIFTTFALSTDYYFFLYIFFIVHNNCSFPSLPLPCPPPSLPSPLHSSEGVRPSLGNQESLACQAEAGRTPPPHPASSLSKVSHNREWAPKAIH